MRTQARRDANETAIVQALEAIGVTCYRVSSKALPDLLTWRQGVWLPIECKVKGGSLTPAQQQTYARSPFPLVASVEEALQLFGVTA